MNLDFSLPKFVEFPFAAMVDKELILIDAICVPVRWQQWWFWSVDCYLPWWLQTVSCSLPLSGYVLVYWSQRRLLCVGKTPVPLCKASVLKPFLSVILAISQINYCENNVCSMYVSELFFGVPVVWIRNPIVSLNSICRSPPRVPLPSAQFIYQLIVLSIILICIP